MRSFIEACCPEYRLTLAQLPYDADLETYVFFSDLADLVSSSISEQPKYIYYWYFRKCYLLVLIHCHRRIALPTKVILVVGGLGMYLFLFGFVGFKFIIITT